MATKHLKVRVRDSQSILYEDEVDHVTSYNEVGRFDIYPMHINFISIIQQSVSFYRGNHKVKEMKVEKAVMKVKQDVVHIFLGIEAFVVEPQEISDAAPKK